jgi:hypothetical protein
MGRTLTDAVRIIVELRKMTYPNGETASRSFVHFDMDFVSYNPDADVINKLLPEIDNAYDQLIEKSKSGNLVGALDQFFKTTSQTAVVGQGFKQALASDLGKTLSEIQESIEITDWFKSIVSYVKKEAHAQKKTDPIRYAESIRQIIDLLGMPEATKLFDANKIVLGRSALTSLYRVANDTPHIKSLIKDNKLKLTIAFELPLVDSEKREEIADQLVAFTTYNEQKEFLKKVKECQ